MTPARHCPSCGQPRTGVGCEYCLLSDAANAHELGARPLWEDLGETGEVFEVIDGFVVLRRLGEGGMGEVFLARQLSTGRTVALKRLRSSETATRFRREIAALASLHHPGLVPILHAGEHAGRLYYAMEWVDGPDLVGWRTQSAPSLREIVALMARATHAVQHAHQLGILHRDLKPQNILVGSDGSPRVTDFGLVRFLAQENPLGDGKTLSGVRLGTPAYMAPEQVRGDRSLEGPWTDVYGMGATLYFLLTGTPPIHGNTPEQLFHNVLEQDVPALRSLRPDCDRDLETIVLGALEKDTTTRYRSAEEWRAELERWLQGLPIQRRRAGPLERVSRWASRHPTTAALSLVLVLVLVIGLSALLFQWHYTQRAQARLGLATTSLRLLEANQLIDQDRVPEALRALAHQLKERPNDTAAASRLVQLLSQRRFLLPIAQCGPTEGPINTARWSPKGSSLLILSAQNPNSPIEIRLWDLVTNQWSSSAKSIGTQPQDVQFSPSGRSLLSLSSLGLQLWHVPTLEPVLLPVPGVATTSEFSWHPSEDAFFSWSGSNHVFRRTPDSNTTQWTHSVENSVQSLTVSGDGSLLAVGTAHGEVRLLNSITGDSLGQPLMHEGSILSVALDGNGQHAGVAVKQRDGSQAFYWWDIARRKSLGPIPSSGPPRFAASGTLIQPGTHRATVLLAATGASSVSWPDLEIPWTHGWLGQSEEVATLQRGKELRLRHGRTGRATSEVLLSPRQIEDVVVSPDGESLAILDHSPVATLWSTRAPTLRPAEIPAARIATFSPDGQRIVTGGRDGEVVWRSSSPDLTESARALARGQVIVARVNPTGSQVFTGTLPGDARLWTNTQSDAGIALDWSDERIQDARFSPDGSMLAVLGSNSILRFFSTRDGQALTPRIPVEAGLESPLGKGSWRVEFSPDGQYVAVGSYSPFVTVWRAGSTNRVRALKHPVAAMTSLGFDPEGTWLATASMDGFVRLWDMKTGRERFPSLAHGGNLTALAITPNGQWIASGGNNGVIRLWRSLDGSPGPALIGHATDNSLIYGLAFSRDGQRLASVSGDHTARIWDVATGLMIADPLELGSTGTSADWSPDGRQLLVGTASGTGFLTPVPVLESTAPPWLPHLAEVMAGNGMESMTWTEWRAIRHEALGMPGSTPYRTWAEWFFGDRRGTLPGNPVW